MSNADPKTPAEKEEYLKEFAGLIWNVGSILCDRVEPDEREEALIWEYLYENLDGLYEPFSEAIDDIETEVFG